MLSGPASCSGGPCRWPRPLRLIAQDPNTGPVPLAAAYAKGLQRLLGVVAAGQMPSVEQIKEHVAHPRATAGRTGRQVRLLSVLAWRAHSSGRVRRRAALRPRHRSVPG
ncbi:DUF6245 family protein [Nonomuraea sp. NPDC003707]